MKRAFFRHIAVLLVVALLVSTTGLAEVLPGEVDESAGVQSGEVTLDFVGETGEEVDPLSETASELDMGTESTGEGTEGEIELLFEEEALGEAAPESDDVAIPESLSLGVGETYALKAENAKYNTSKKSVATVDEKGVITAKKKGKAKITVKSGKKTLGVCNVTVLAAPDKLELSEGKLTLSVSRTYQLKALLPKKTASQIKWTSSKKKVATVDENGVVTAVGKGTAKITAKTFNGHKAVCKVAVNTDPAELSLPMKQLSVGVKEKAAIVPIVNEGAEAKFTWSVKKKSIAAVTQKGVITGKKVGSTKVTVSTQNGLKASMTVKVLSAPSKVTLSQTSATLEPGATLQLKAKLPKKTTSQIKWTSSEEKVATVDENGLVTAVAEGTANITASTYNGKKATCAVTVKGADKPITAVMIRFDDVVAGDDVVVLPDEAVTASWSADGDVESYDYSILDAESREIVSERASQATSCEIAPDMTAPEAVYTLKVGARPVGGTDEEVVWKSARFMRTDAEDGDFIIVDGVVTGYTGPGGDIEIPATDAKGDAVIAIGEGAFKGNAAITGAAVSNGIVEIRAQAFADSGLKEITLPKTITIIAEDAFANCEPLAAHAPMGCYAYNWCVEHGLIAKGEATPAEYFKYETINGLYAKITGYTGEDSVVVVPSVIDDYTIQVIANNAFKKNDTIEYVTIPDTVIEIGSGVFEGCTSLVGVDVGKSVEKIGSRAFYGCLSLLGVDFPDTLKTTGSELFRKCVNLEYFDYPLNWENAGNRTIEECPKITKLVVPEGAKIRL